MKRLLIPTTLVVVLAACSESPMAPVLDAGPSFIALHNAIPVPTAVTSSVVPATIGSAVTLSWNWSDAQDGWDLVSFTMTRGGVDVGGSIANAKPYTAGANLQRSHVDAGVADGTYEYCVEVMAKYKSGPREATVTHHSKSCITVTVGSVTYSINVLGGSAANGSINANAANFNFAYQLLMNGVVVTDCSIVPGVATTPSAVLNHHNCDAATGDRNALFENPTKGTSNSFTTTWTMNGNTIHTENFTS